MGACMCFNYIAHIWRFALLSTGWLQLLQADLRSYQCLEIRYKYQHVCSQQSNCLLSFGRPTFPSTACDVDCQPQR